mgnify:CR=1 FL=1
MTRTTRFSNLSTRLRVLKPDAVLSVLIAEQVVFQFVDPLEGTETLNHSPRKTPNAQFSNLSTRLRVLKLMGIATSAQ